MNRRIARLMPKRKRGLVAILGALVAASLAVAGYAGTSASAARSRPPGRSNSRPRPAGWASRRACCPGIT
jgi:hypothetical protein